MWSGDDSQTISASKTEILINGPGQMKIVGQMSKEATGPYDVKTIEAQISIKPINSLTPTIVKLSFEKVFDPQTRRLFPNIVMDAFGESVTSDAGFSAWEMSVESASSG
jgi:hypothetical protein